MTYFICCTPLLGDFRVSWGRFWEPFGHLFGHGCESENVFLLNTVLFEFFVDFRVSWGRFWSLLGIFSGMGAKVETVLAPAREFDFQGLGGSGSVLFEGLARTSF